VIIVFAVAVLVIGGSKLVYLTWDLRQYSAVLGLPIAFVYSIIPVTGVLVVIYALAAFPHVPDADTILEVE
jgi:TRAP-type C4-dicarboxylate transport system permease small subunit